MAPFKRFYCCALAATLACNALYSGAAELSLQQALQLALERNPTLQAEGFAVRAAEAEDLKGRAAADAAREAWDRARQVIERRRTELSTWAERTCAGLRRDAAARAERGAATSRTGTG